MIILGLNIYHNDSSSCIVSDGKLVCAIEEERIRREKHWKGFPSESIKWCLGYASIGIKDVDHIAVLRGAWRDDKKEEGLKKELSRVFNVKEEEIKAKITVVEHHQAHIASSFFVSPFKEAAVVSIDEFGDFISLMTGIGKDNKIIVKDIVRYPNSLGVFYSALTQFLGFSNYGDEYKVMGLSAYGKPKYRRPSAV